MLILKTASLVSLGLLLVGALGYFSLSRGHWIFYLFAHLGALGVMGLFGSLTAWLARRKSRNLPAAFALGFAFPVLAGIAAVLVFYLAVDGNWYCGGSVSLAAAVLVTLYYLVVKKASATPEV